MPVILSFTCCNELLALCEADYTLDLSPYDESHEERSKPLDAEVEEAFRLECRARLNFVIDVVRNYPADEDSHDEAC